MRRTKQKRYHKIDLVNRILKGEPSKEDNKRRAKHRGYQKMGLANRTPKYELSKENNIRRT